GDTAGQAAQTLHDAGFSAADTVGALRSVYNTSAPDTIKLLHDAGYGAAETLQGVQGLFLLIGTIQVQAQILHDAGYSATDTATALVSEFSTFLLPPEAITPDLVAVGYGGGDIALALK